MEFTEQQQQSKAREWVLALALNHYFRGRIGHAVLWEVYLAYGYPADCLYLREALLRRVR